MATVMSTAPQPGAFLIVALAASLTLSCDPAMAQDGHQPGNQAIGESVRFQNGSATLSGSLLTPPGPAPHPAFVLSGN